MMDSAIDVRNRFLDGQIEEAMKNYQKAE